MVLDANIWLPGGGGELGRPAKLPFRKTLIDSQICN